jgi:hypothetical protein
MAQAPSHLRGKARREWYKNNPQGQTQTQTTADPASTMSAGDKAIEALYGKQAVEAGIALGQKFYSDGSLGKVSENIPGQDEYLAQLKAGLGGYTSPQYQASREQMMKGQQSNFATAQAQLAKAQARGKVYGAAGAAQQANLATGSQASKDDLEQQLMVKNIDEQQNRLNNYGTANAAAQAAVLERNKINLGQTAAEKAGQVGAFTGAAGTQAISDAQKQQSDIMNKALAALQGNSATKKNTSKPKPKAKKGK